MLLGPSRFGAGLSPQLQGSLSQSARACTSCTVSTDAMADVHRGRAACPWPPCCAAPIVLLERTAAPHQWLQLQPCRSHNNGPPSCSVFPPRCCGGPPQPPCWAPHLHWTPHLHCHLQSEKLQLSSETVGSSHRPQAARTNNKAYQQHARLVATQCHNAPACSKHKSCTALVHSSLKGPAWQRLQCRQ